MALAKKCDVCGKLYEYYGCVEKLKIYNKQNSIIIANFDICHDRRCASNELDLCPECMESFVNWLLKRGEINQEVKEKK